MSEDSLITETKNKKFILNTFKHNELDNMMLISTLKEKKCDYVMCNHNMTSSDCEKIHTKIANKKENKKFNFIYKNDDASRLQYLKVTSTINKKGDVFYKFNVVYEDEL